MCGLDKTVLNWQDSSLTENGVDQKHHQSRSTECVLAKCVISSDGVRVVVLNNCTLFSQHTVGSNRLDGVQIGQQKFPWHLDATGIFYFIFWPQNCSLCPLCLLTVKLSSIQVKKFCNLQRWGRMNERKNKKWVDSKPLSRRRIQCQPSEHFFLEQNPLLSERLWVRLS